MSQPLSAARAGTAQAAASASPARALARGSRISSSWKERALAHFGPAALGQREDPVAALEQPVDLVRREPGAEPLVDRGSVEGAEPLQGGTGEMGQVLLRKQLVVGAERAREVDRVDLEGGIDQHVPDAVVVGVVGELVDEPDQVDLTVPG